MNTSARAKTLAFDQHTMWVELDDGRSLGVPLAWFPRLMYATPRQRENYRIGYSDNVKIRSCRGEVGDFSD